MGATRRAAQAPRARRDGPAPARGPAAEEQRPAPAAPQERELLEVLLAEPDLVPAALPTCPSGARSDTRGCGGCWTGLYALQAEGEPPTLDLLRARLDNPRLAETALELQEVGPANPDRAAWLRQLLAEFRTHGGFSPLKQELQNQLHAASDHAAGAGTAPAAAEPKVGIELWTPCHLLTGVPLAASGS